MKRKFGYLTASLLIAVACNASAQTSGQEQVAGKIASNFTTLAGSQENALALVRALRAGETVQLTYAPTGTSTTPTIASVDPVTGPMGWGNVKISLGLAQDQLRRLGITNPTAEQLQAALNGGDVTVTRADGTTTTTTLRGVLQMRADGMGWGQIAQVGGTKVGPVVSRLKMGNNTKGATTTAANTTTSPKSTGVTTATNAKASTSGKGITTGADASAAKGGISAKGLTTAGGVAATASARGLTTAQGAAAGSNGNAYGRGIVTAAGGGANASTANGNAGGNGKGHGADHGKGKGA